MRRTRWSRAGGLANRPSPWVLLALETLEERAVPTAGLFVVNLPGDAGTGSGGSGDFRYCLQQANQFKGSASVTFAINENLSLSLALPAITNCVTIQGLGTGNTIISRSPFAANFGVFDIAPGAVVSLQSLTISDGLADQGAGIHNQGQLTVTDCLIENNVATGALGGGILNDSGASLTLLNSSVFGNQVTPGTGRGGGLFSLDGDVTVNQVNFLDNSAGIGGGAAIESDSFRGSGFGNPSFTNCTFTGNRADYGTALYFETDRDVLFVSLDHCTIAYNLPDNAPGQPPGPAFPAPTPGSAVLGIANYSLIVSSVNSLFAHNQGVNFNGLSGGDTSTQFQSLGNNLSDDGTGNLTAPGDLPNTDPLLAPGSFSQNQFVFPLLPGSPALDAGTGSDSVTVDQRGVSRPQGNAPDIGAFESRPLTFDAISGDFQSALAGQRFASPLQVQLTEGPQGLFRVPVTFQVVQETGSVAFRGSNLTATVETDRSGIATAPPLIALGVPGLATISATAGNQSVFFTVFVNSGPVAHYLFIGPPSIQPGQTFAMTVVPEDAFGNLFPAGLGTVSFTSTDPLAVLPSFNFPASSDSSQSFAVQGNGPTPPPVPGGFIIPGFSLGSSGTQTIAIHDPANPSAGGSIAVTVPNFAPQGVQLNLPSSVSDGSAFTLTGSFTDPAGGQQAHQVTLDWGDGSSTAISLPAGTTTFSASHAYQLVLPAGQATLPIGATATDADGASATASASVTVTNVAPGIQAGDAAFANIGVPFSRVVTLTDPDSNPLMVTVDYGDGTPQQTLSVGPGSLPLAHTYQADGSFNVRLTVDDGEGGRAAGGFRVDVFLPGVNVHERGSQEASVSGASAVLIPGPGSTGHGVIIVAVVPVPVAAVLNRGIQVSAGKVISAAYDVRAIAVGPNDAGIITFHYFSASPTDQPTLTWFDRRTGRQEPVVTDQYTVDTVHRTITFVLDRDSSPRLQQLGGTVFTISVPAPVPPSSSVIPTVSRPTEANLLAVMVLLGNTPHEGATRAADTVGENGTGGQGLVRAAADRVASTGVNGGGAEGSGGGTLTETGPLRDLPPASASLFTLPSVTFSASQIEPSLLPLPRVQIEGPREQPPPALEGSSEEAAEAESPAPEIDEPAAAPLGLVLAGVALVGDASRKRRR